MVSVVEVNIQPPPSRPERTTETDGVVYTSLIQTYLNLLNYDNATFLAERYAAFYPGDENAVYLLAYCYYRNGDKKAARSTLLNRWNGRNLHDEEGDVELARVRNSARYLLATCCFDLGMYGEAEEALLRHARERLSEDMVRSKGKIRGNMNDIMDAWLLETDPCPVPNGPAGLHLLGNICRKTNRRQRAIEYYRLSLKLDPLMWTSYEAMCEMGGPAGSSGEADNPISIFGVDAPTLLAPKMGATGKQIHATPFQVNKIDHNNAVEESSPVETQESFTLNHRFGTPSTPYSTFDKMTIGIKHATASSQFTSAKGSNLDIHNHLNRPATGSTIAPRSRVSGNDTGLPQTNLFNVTPAIAAPSFRSPTLETPATAKIPGSNAGSVSAINFADQVLTKARQVATGHYYEPSPDATKPILKSPTSELTANRSKNIFDSRFNDMSAIPDTAAVGTHLSFSTNLQTTPNAGTSPFNAGVSSVKGEKRALSPMEMDPRKKPGQEKEKADFSNVAVTERPEHGQDEYECDAEMERVCVKKVLQLLSTFGAAYKYLCQYRSNDALEIFRELPPSQINTGWVQHQIGKAYFEMSDYQNAEKALLKMQKLESHRMKGLDVLSTTLWHLKKEVELSDLAQKVVDFDRMSPEAWFVVGNCFSFQKEHDTAISFFHRSIQLDPTYTYAHTLCGHEYMSNEDFDKAISCYRDAIRVDVRHYNAWYGMGAIYFRQEKFELAEYHFQRALAINPQSSVLHCHLGMAQHHNGKTFDALETLAGAFLLDSRNPQAHYQRATIFMSLDRPQEALLELEKVRSAAPREASVHFNMGKVLKRLGQPEKAMRCFLTALDLDPKDNNLIKAAMDRLDEDDVEEEVSVF